MRIGEEAMWTPLHRLSSGPVSNGRAAALSGGSSGLGEQHQDCGADIASQENGDQGGGERKAMLQREELGCISGATAKHGHGLIPSCDRLPFRSTPRLLLWCSAGCALAHMRRKAKTFDDDLLLRSR